MRKPYTVIAILYIALVAVSCTRVPTNTPTTTPNFFQKQPEPQSPMIKGEFSGLPDYTLVTIHIFTLSGQEIQWGTRRGNGTWESVIPNNPDQDYVVTAEVEGYTSTPISYSVHTDGITAFLIDNGKITTNEALHLDFYFDPVANATPSE